MDTKEPARASALLKRLHGRMTGDKPSLGEVLGHLGDRAPGFLLLALAIPAVVPTPGLSAGLVFGTVLVLVALAHQSLRAQRKAAAEIQAAAAQTGEA